MEHHDSPSDKLKTAQRIQRKQNGGFFGTQNSSSFFGNGKTGHEFFGAKPVVQQQEDTNAIDANDNIVQEKSEQDVKQRQATGTGDASTAVVPPATGTTTTAPATTATTCSPEADTAKQSFLAGTYGPRSVVPPLDGTTAGYGGFEAQYIPASNTLNIKVRGKIQFIDALTGTGVGISAAADDYVAIANLIKTMPADAQAELLAYFQWNPAAKAAGLAQFRTQLAGAVNIWQNTGMYFQVNETCWEDVKAYPKFSLEVTEEGTATYNTTTDAAGGTTVDPTSDHLQVKIFKSPTPKEQDAVNARIDQLEKERKMCLIRPNTELRAYVDGDRGNANSYGNTDAHDNDMNLSSNDLNNMPDGERGGNNMLRLSVNFAKDSAVVSAQDVGRINAFLEDFKQSGDTNAENNAINLVGFASAEGSTTYNTALVDRRLQSVRAIVNGFGIKAGQDSKETAAQAVGNEISGNIDDIGDIDNIDNLAGESVERDVTGRINTDNRSDLEAETLANADQPNERRVEIRIGSGEKQNTLAHEFGHIFGLADEYTEGDRGAGQNAGHDQMAKNAGVSTGARTENSDNIISMGNTVRPQHYAPFANALNQLTSKTWHVKP